MSFLNPVSEPVLRFKSTDAGAPQINYNARVAGDVKAVLKACLVTGYGAIASAGWAAANEVGNVIEFVSPSAAMSDYRLGVDDSTTTKTDWYYQYQDARVNPSYNAPTKSFTYIDKVNTDNGWQLLVTERGIIFIEIVYSSTVGRLAQRITYWGQLKSAIPNTTGKNISFFNIGYNAAITSNAFIYNSTSYIHAQIEIYTAVYWSAATSNALNSTYLMDVSDLDLASQIYLANTGRSLILGAFTPMLSKIVNKSSDTYGLSESVIDGRNVINVCAGFASNNLSVSTSYSNAFLIYSDYWEY